MYQCKEANNCKGIFPPTGSVCYHYAKHRHTASCDNRIEDIFTNGIITASYSSSMSIGERSLIINTATGYSITIDGNDFELLRDRLIALKGEYSGHKD